MVMQELGEELSDTRTANFGLSRLSRSQPRVFVTMALAFLPFLATVLCIGRGWAALNMFGYAIMIVAVGYGVVSAALA